MQATSSPLFRIFSPRTGMETGAMREPSVVAIYSENPAIILLESNSKALSLEAYTVQGGKVVKGGYNDTIATLRELNTLRAAHGWEPVID